MNRQALLCLARGHLAVVRNRYRRCRRRRLAPQVLLNVNRVSTPEGQRRALLVFLARPFLLPAAELENPDHHNFKQAVQIAQCLGDAGYVVDVADVNSTRMDVTHDYDVIVCHAANPPWPADRWAGACRVYLATGTDHRFHNARLRTRLERLRARRPGAGVEAVFLDEQMAFPAASDAIAGFGNAATLATWSDHVGVPVYGFNNYGFASTRFISSRAPEAAGHFLFFGSTQQLCKGLDLLLEIVPRHPDLHLHVCGRYAAEPRFCRTYWRELFACPNVHLHDHVKVNGPVYEELVRQCAFIVHPSCSEGQPSSVAQGMHSGLIPIVTPQCGMDAGGGVRVVDADDLSALERTLLECARSSASVLAEESRRVRQLAEDAYSEAAFKRSWKGILAAVTDRRGALPSRGRPA